MNDEPLFSLGYVSRATPLLDEDALREIERISNRHNALHDISGVLIVEGDAVTQILEGPEREIRRLMERIETDPRHREVKVFGANPIPVRVVGEWSMAVRRLERAPPSLRTPLQNLLEIISQSRFPLELNADRIETFRKIATLCG